MDGKNSQRAETELPKTLLGLNLTPEYFNLYSYLSDQQEVDVELTVNCPYLLAPANSSSRGSRTISAAAHTRVKVPISTARILQQQGIGMVCLPAFLDLEQGFLREFRGATLTNEECCILPLNSHSPFFFEVALKCITLSRDASTVDEKELELENLEQLIHTILNERTKRICNLARTEHPADSYMDAKALKKWTELQTGHSQTSHGGFDIQPTTESDIAFLSTLTVPEKDLLRTRVLKNKGLI